MALREEIEMFRVMWTNEYGTGETNQDGFSTEKDAQEYCADLQKSFSQEDYYVESYAHYEYTRGLNEGISGGVDGWEDMYPQ